MIELLTLYLSTTMYIDYSYFAMLRYFHLQYLIITVLQFFFHC